MNFSNFVRQHWAAFRALLVLTVITGIAYPLFIWLVAQVPGLRDNANGSIIEVDGKPVGSSLIGQLFTDSDGNALPQYFQSRPSAAGERVRPARDQRQQPGAGEHRRHTRPIRRCPRTTTATRPACSPWSARAVPRSASSTVSTARARSARVTVSVPCCP